MLKKFISLHGLVVLKNCLIAHMDSKTICRQQILTVLKCLPIGTKNSVLKLEPLVEKMTDLETFGYEVSTLAKELLDSWAGLQLVYKIPKREISRLEAVSPAPSVSRNVSGSSSSTSDVKDSEEAREKNDLKQSKPLYRPELKPWRPKPLPVAVFTPIIIEEPVALAAGEAHVIPGVSLDAVNSAIEAAALAAKQKEMEQEEAARIRKEKKTEYFEKLKERREAAKQLEKAEKLRIKEAYEAEKLRKSLMREKRKEVGDCTSDVSSSINDRKIHKEGKSKKKKKHEISADTIGDIKTTMWLLKNLAGMLSLETTQIMATTSQFP